jgi:adenylate cyclase
MASRLISFFGELKRRNVYRAAAVYIVVGLGILGAAEVILDPLDLGGLRGAIVILVLLGFPIALVLAWAVELTPTGIRRTEATDTRTRTAVEGSEPQNLRVSQDSPAPDPRSVAVLPFTNLGADLEHRFFSDGVTEDVLTHLGKVKSLHVTSRTSVMQYKGTTRHLRDIARELGVATVLEGSVRAVGGRVRVVAQLIDARTDTHLWAETYDREVQDIFAVQSEVAESVARALAAELSGEELEEIHQPPTEDVAAYSLCLEGIEAFRADELREWTRALGLFEAALRIDPDYAQAHAGLALVLIWYPWLTFRMPARYRERLKTSVRRALDLDPSLAYAWLSQGVYLWSYERDWLGAEEALQRAEALDPDDPFVLQSRAFFAYMLGRFDESERYLDRMKALGQRSFQAEVYGAMLETYRAVYGEMDLDLPIRRFDALASRYPDYGTVHLHRAVPLLLAGRNEEALSAIEAGLLSAPQAPFGHGMRGAILARLGRVEEALAEDEWFRKAPGAELADRFSWAMIAFALQDVDRAFDLLEEGSGSHTSLLLAFLRLTPAYQSLWDHPRFLALMDIIWPGEHKKVLGPYGWQPEDVGSHEPWTGRS